MKYHMFKRHITSFITTLIFTASLQAGTDLNHPLTIPELVDIALENSPTTRQAWWNANRAAAALGSAKSAYYPKIDADLSVQNGQDFKFINGPDVNYTIFGADILLSMMLYDYGGREANVCAAKMALLAANWQSDWSIQKVLVKVLENAYSTVHAQEVVQAAVSAYEDAVTIFETAQELNHAGLSPVSDVYAAQTTLSQMKMDLILQKALLDIQKAKLAASLGLCATTSIELAQLDETLVAQCNRTDELIALALNQRGDLMAKQARIMETLANQDRARAGYGPKVSFFGRGGANHALHDKTNAMQYQVLLDVEIPIFNGFDTMYQNRMAYADTQISTEDYAELQLNIVLEVLTYSRTLQAAQEMFGEAQINLESSQKAYDGTLDRYKAGKDRITDLSYAQRQLAAARVRYSDVKTRWLVSMANLAYATGTLVPYMETK